MKKLLIVALLIFNHRALCALLGEERDWGFIQSVGGISIGEPVLGRDNWLLPVHCNVAGLREITVKPTMLNSGLVWADTEVRIKGNVIYLSIETALVGMGGETSDCSPARLGYIKPGKYEVRYLSPNKSSNEIVRCKLGYNKSARPTPAAQARLTSVVPQYRQDTR